VFDTITGIVKNTRDSSSVDALIEALGDILDGSPQGGEISDADAKRIQTEIDKFDQIEYEPNTMRKALQMMILKVSKADQLQANYQLTPDTIGDVVSYIASGLLENRQSLSILDPAMGTGNLLTTVINGLTNNINVEAHPYGLENDDAMFEIAASSFELQQVQADLYHEDAITDVMVPKVDLIVSDLPIGYYPIDENVANFETKAEKGHSFVHHLFLEMAANHLADGGVGIFLVPSAIFKSDEAKSLLKWMQGKVYLQGLLNLPKDLFANEAAQKSILILQKVGGDAKQAEPVMLGEFPSFKDAKGVQNFLTEIDEWRKNNMSK